MRSVAKTVSIHEIQQSMERVRDQVPDTYTRDLVNMGLEFPTWLVVWQWVGALMRDALQEALQSSVSSASGLEWYRNTIRPQWTQLRTIVTKDGPLPRQGPARPRGRDV
jgi:hypothetical protein